MNKITIVQNIFKSRLLNATKVKQFEMISKDYIAQSMGEHELQFLPTPIYLQLLSPIHLQLLSPIHLKLLTQSDSFIYTARATKIIIFQLPTKRNMSITLIQKIFVAGSIGASILFMGAMYFKSPKSQKHDAFKIRQELIKTDDVKMLYSTMSFFYLQGFHSKSIDSFYKLHDILQIEKPQLVAIPVSKEDYDDKYLKVMSHPKFRQAMDTFLYSLKTKNQEEIKNMTAFDLKSLENLMLIDHCNKIKKCKVVLCRKSSDHYKKLQQSYETLKQQNSTSASGDNAKIQDYTDILVSELKPGMKFTIMPESPFKSIVGLIEPQLMRGVSQRWKDKFKQNYSHTIIQDEEVLEREKLLREVEGKSI